MDIASGKAKVGDIPQLVNDAMNVTVGDAYADMTGASTIICKGITDFARKNPVVHSVLMLTTPAYAPLYDTARMKMFATTLASGRGETLTAKEVAEVVGGTFAQALFPNNPALQSLTNPTLASGILDMGRYGAEQAVHLAEDFDDWVEFAQKLLTSVKEIYNQMQDFLKYLDDDIWPAVEMMRDLVVNPYLAAVKDSKASMDDLIKHYQDAGQSVDSSVPSIIGPNLDLRQYQQIALGYSLPIVGSVYAGMTRGLIMQKYQAQHQRGFADDLSMLQSAMSFGGPSLLTPVQQMIQAGRPPAWFMSK